MNNIEKTVIAAGGIAAGHFSGVFGAFYWVGGMLVIPAAVVVVHFRQMSGGVASRLLLVTLPWLVLVSLGLVDAAGMDHEGQRTTTETYYLLTFLSASIGALIVTAPFALPWSNKGGKR